MTIRETRLQAAIVRDGCLLLVQWTLRGGPFLYSQLKRIRATLGLRGAASSLAAG